VHANEIIHHDIKPDNILITDSGHVKIADFGVSQYYENYLQKLYKIKDVKGTPAFIPPEAVDSLYLSISRSKFIEFFK
jgi:serine/threonine protein kinase